MELRVYLDPNAPLSFVEPLVAPADAPNSRPWLSLVGDLLLIARTGTYKGAFSNQNASLIVQLDNRGNQASTLLGRPLRVKAEVYDGAALWFSGVIGVLTYGTQFAIEIDA